jgi:hypothetical protein
VTAVGPPEEVELRVVLLPEAEFEYNSSNPGFSAKVNRVYLSEHVL